MISKFDSYYFCFRLLLLRDVKDVDLRVVCTVSVFLTEAFPSFHFEGDDLITLYVADDLRFDNSLYVFSDGKGTITGSQKNFSEFNFVTGVARDTGNVQSLVFLDLKLLTGYFHYC